MEVKVEIEKSIQLLPTDPFYKKSGIGLYRQRFRDAVDSAQRWQEEAREDYKFVEGRQWSKSELKDFADQQKPALVINRIRPLLNLLSGYQRLNRYDISFLARTPDDVELCSVREGVTKYILDRCNYQTAESAVFLDAAISGLGWFEVGYQIDEERNDRRLQT